MGDLSYCPYFLCWVCYLYYLCNRGNHPEHAWGPDIPVVAHDKHTWGLDTLLADVVVVVVVVLVVHAVSLVVVVLVLVMVLVMVRCYG